MRAWIKEHVESYCAKSEPVIASDGGGAAVSYCGPKIAVDQDVHGHSPYEYDQTCEPAQEITITGHSITVPACFQNVTTVIEIASKPAGIDMPELQEFQV